MEILIENGTVVPMTGDGRETFRAAVGIRGGRIAMVDRDGSRTGAFRAEAGDRLRVIDAEGKAVMPGLINLHNHVAMALMRSVADDMPLMPWLQEKIWPYEAKLNGDDIYWGAKLGIAEMLMGGTTTFADMYARSQRVGEAVEELGIRAVLAPPFIDGRMEAFEREAVEMIGRYHGSGDGRIGVRIAPHAPYTCSPESIARALRLCERYGVGVHVHVAETQDEIATVRERYGKTPVEYLDDLGVFRYPTLAAHCVHLTGGDMEIMLQRGVTVAYNPQSNMKLASGVAPVAEMLRRGLAVGFGTDGPSSNNDLDMWEELRTGSLLQKVTTGDPTALPAHETLRMATAGGADALGMGDRLGRVAEGMLADLIVVDLRKPHLCPNNDLLSDLAYCGKASDVETVIVDGRIAVEGRKLCTADYAAVCRGVKERVAEIARR
ncbi:MAG: amidohydrolase [Rikenellaceae bacterium]|nr:amidohydrolase [Rikenellaceae bacterium]